MFYQPMVVTVLFNALTCWGIASGDETCLNNQAGQLTEPGPTAERSTEEDAGKIRYYEQFFRPSPGGAILEHN